MDHQQDGPLPLVDKMNKSPIDLHPMRFEWVILLKSVSIRSASRQCLRNFVGVEDACGSHGRSIFLRNRANMFRVQTSAFRTRRRLCNPAQADHHAKLISGRFGRNAVFRHKQCSGEQSPDDFGHVWNVQSFPFIGRLMVIGMQ